GHCFSSPVSLEIPSRLAPRHCGHSPLVWPAMIVAAQNRKRTPRINAVTDECFMTTNPFRKCEANSGRQLELRLRLKIQDHARTGGGHHEPEIEHWIRRCLGRMQPE